MAVSLRKRPDALPLPYDPHRLPSLAEYRVTEVVLRLQVALDAWLDEFNIDCYHDHARKRCHVAAHQPVNVDTMLHPSDVAAGWVIVWDGPNPAWAGTDWTSV